MPKRSGEGDGPTQKKRRSERLSVRLISLHGAKNKEDAEQVQECKLFALPAELRNSIYEEVLQQGADVSIDADTRIPALLQVSKQVRSETQAMWYEGNTFLFIITDCDGAVVSSWHRLCMALDYTDINFNIMIRGDPNWSNLMKWCKAVCEDDCVAVQGEPDDSDLTSVVVSATSIAFRFAEVEGRWEDCEKVLLELRHMAVIQDGDWSK
ncbi:hypothetical protein LTR17_006422 [Elasticomyces elasticus]|nr:hypothetical protein LTR17_006422 [Elasticomyces elasticus]